MEDVGWTCEACTYSNQHMLSACTMCGNSRHYHGTGARGIDNGVADRQEGGSRFALCIVPGFLAEALSGTLTGMFALAGAFTGAITGAIAGRATESGLLRGAGLGAVAGAVLSVEVLEASRAYWYSRHSGSRGSSSMANFIEDLLNGRFVQEQVGPAMLTAYQWQINIAEMTYEDIYDIFGEGGAKGMSGESLGNLPWHLITLENKNDASGENICCAICLQDLQQGETARSLPSCHHTFHMPCVDKWLIGHGSCPVCRREI